MVARLEHLHAAADFANDPRALMPPDDGKHTLPEPRDLRKVGVAQTGGVHFDQNLVHARAFEVHVLDFERLTRNVRRGSPCS
jgi:hypothetical protein